MSAEAANRDLEARLSRANDDRRAAETWLAELTKERDRLVTRVKTLERDLGTARMAAGAPAKPPAQTRAPRCRGGGGGGARPPVSGTFWPARNPGMPRPRHAPARCWSCRRVSGWPCWRVGRSRWTPWRLTWPSSLPPTRKCAGSTPPPHRLTSAAMDASFAEAVVEQSSQGSAGWSSAPGVGWGVAHPLTSGPLVPFNLHDVNCTFLYMNICTNILPAPPPPAGAV